ncbi:MAG: hypothetical protein KatS3mg132_635 [Limisphaera sp.]|nr:MAG: hypothetical protein KatS3mg132_635 [Limisphaera sp.]
MTAIENVWIRVHRSRIPAVDASIRKGVMQR